MGSGVTFESLLGHFGVGLPESLLGHFNSFWVSVEFGARPLHNSECAHSKDIESKKGTKIQCMLANVHVLPKDMRDYKRLP